MELERNNILKGIEEQWRLRNRAIWMASGDSNTKFFHKLCYSQQSRKHIWEIMDTQELKITDQGAIKGSNGSSFQKFLQGSHSSNTIEQLKIIELFPQIVNE
jgi:hypothetical protein